jgi:hypothetical protein
VIASSARVRIRPSLKRYTARETVNAIGLLTFALGRVL